MCKCIQTNLWKRKILLLPDYIHSKLLSYYNNVCYNLAWAGITWVFIVQVIKIIEIINNNKKIYYSTRRALVDNIITSLVLYYEISYLLLSKT